MDISIASHLHPDFTPRTLVEVGQWRALYQSQEQGYIFLVNDEEHVSITYAELDHRARAVAARLQALHLAGERALILYPPGIEYIVAFLGCLYAGVVAIPAYPPHMNRSLSRLLAIITNAQPQAVLTDAQTLASTTKRFAQTSLLQLPQWIITDDIDIDLAQTWQDPHVTPDTLAFLQYSSGSTAVPKGIMLSHKNVLHNIAQLSAYSQTSLHSRGVTWLPPYHDMGLIGSLLQALYVGFPLICLSPLSFLQRPLRWLQAISTYRATHTAAPNFAYALCANKVTLEERDALDLSCWTFASCGAEPVSAVTLDAFTEAFAPCGFRRETLYPCYGLAEATLFVTGGSLEAEPIVKLFEKQELLQNRVALCAAPADSAKALVGCGQTTKDQRLLIVDPSTSQPCLPDRIGEIWISGPSIAQGYWNKPEESLFTFQATLTGTDESPFLRTGDLGFLLDGELFITGRQKDLIIIHGNNYYPQDIELTAGQSHPALRKGSTAAFSIEVENEEQLVVVQEVDRQYRDLDVPSICQTLRQEVVSQHEVQVYTIVLIKQGSLPKTSSGKIQRYACREDFLAQRLHVLGESTLPQASQMFLDSLSGQYVAPRTPTEQALAEIWQDLLGIEQVGIEDNFFALGGQSILAAQLISRVQEVFRKEISIRVLFENATISGFIAEMEGTEEGQDEEDEPGLVSLDRTQYFSTKP